jgi:hypothetical protein
MTDKQRVESHKLAYKLVLKQAEDDGLWFSPQYASEAYLQQALRELAYVIEEAR